MKALNDWSENPEKVATSCGLPMDILSTSEPVSNSVSNTSATCNICFDDVDPNDLTALGCGHRYCSGNIS